MNKPIILNRSGIDEILWQEKNIQVVSIKEELKILYEIKKNISVILNPQENSLDLHNKIVKSPLYSFNKEEIATEQLTTYGFLLDNSSNKAVFYETDLKTFSTINNRFLWITSFYDFPRQGVMLINNCWHMFDLIWEQYPFDDAFYGIYKLNSDQVRLLMREHIKNTLIGCTDINIKDYTLGHFYTKARDKQSLTKSKDLFQWFNTNNYIKPNIDLNCKNLVAITIF
jgi:hypothetical protein